MNIYKTKHVDLNKMVYSSVRGNDKKKFVMIGYKQDKKVLPFVIQTPNLYCGNDLEKTGDVKTPYQLDVSVKGDMYNFLNNLNKKVISDVHDNRENWFGGSKELKYKSLIRKDDVFRLKFSKNKNFETRVFGEEKEVINPMECLKADTCNFKVIIEITALWITDNNYFGLALRVYQLSVENIPNPLIKSGEFAFIDDSDEDDCFNFACDKDLHELTDMYNTVKPEIILNENDSVSSFDINDIVE